MTSLLSRCMTLLGMLLFAVMAGCEKTPEELALELEEALLDGDAEEAAELIDKGADVHYVLQDGGMLLHLAASQGRGSIVEALVAAGAAVEARDRTFNETPLLAAYRFKPADSEVVQALLAAGADVGAKDKDQKTALHFAAKSGDVEGMKRLLAAGADVDARDTKGNTPLHEAAVALKPTTVEALLAAGGDPNARSNDGQSVIGAARNLRFLQPWSQRVIEGSIVPMLLQAGAEAELGPDGVRAN